MKTKQLSHIMRFLVGVVITILIIALTPIAQAQQYSTDRRTDKFFFGAALGLQTDTPDSTAYAIGFMAITTLPVGYQSALFSRWDSLVISCN